MSIRTTFAKRFCLPFLFLAVTTALFSSCDKKVYNSVRTYSISDAQLERLKGQTAVLVLPESEYTYIDDYKKLVSNAWKLTPIEVIRYSDLPKYSDISKYAFFNMRGLRTTSTSSTSSYSNTHYYLTLSSYYMKKKKMESDDFCRIELYPDFKTTNMTFSKKNDGDDLYQNATIRNFTLPYILAYLQTIEKNVKAKTSPAVFEEYTDQPLRSRLVRDTLYVPDQLLFSRNKFNGRETEKEENFFQSYKGPYRMIATKDLIELIKTRDAKKPLFLFEYVLSSSEKYVGVLEIHSGKIVYRRYTPMTYNLKAKDLEKIIE